MLYNTVIQRPDRMATKTAIDAAVSGRKGRQWKKRKQYKKLIEQAAIKEFMEKGFMGASLRQIVKNAGVTTGAFYKYYPTKEKAVRRTGLRNMRSIYTVYMTSSGRFEELSPSQQQTRMKSISHNGVDRIISMCINTMIISNC